LPILLGKTLHDNSKEKLTKLAFDEDESKIEKRLEIRISEKSLQKLIETENDREKELDEFLAFESKLNGGENP
jgi:hypothetical protein